MSGVIVRGLGDIASAVAHLLYQEGFGVVIHDRPEPTTTRRRMAFADAAFDGRATLEGVDAVRVQDPKQASDLLATLRAIPVYVGPLDTLVRSVDPDVLVDARMRKHHDPEVQRGLARLTIGLGPSVVAGLHADVVVETSWEGLGMVLWQGAALPLSGEPRTLGGHARERYVYAPRDGVFRTKAQIGDAVHRGQIIAEIGDAVLVAPLDGVVRGLTRDAVPVLARTKVIEIDPRSRADEVHGIGARPRRIAEGVLSAIQTWRGGAAGS
jgi:xanthine dehydrogenase accessory factor